MTQTTYDNWVCAQGRELTQAEFEFLDEPFGYAFGAFDGSWLTRIPAGLMLMAKEADWKQLPRSPHVSEDRWKISVAVPFTIGAFFDLFRDGTWFVLSRELQPRWNTIIEHPTLTFPPYQLREPFEDWKLLGRRI
jgi:hypothetical protein